MPHRRARALLALVLLTAVPLAACAPEERGLQGYVEGDYVTVAAPDAGWIDTIDVERGAAVEPGTLLFTLDATRETAARDAAKASAAQAAARLALAETELMRQEKLAPTSAGSRQRLDQARAERDSALAARDLAAAQLAEAEWRLSQRRVAARVGGFVDDVVREKGEYVPPGGAIVRLLPPGNVKLRFYAPESALPAIKMGQTIGIACDGCVAGMTARVSFIASEAEFTPPVIYSVGQREKLMFLIEARPADGAALRPGQPVDIALAP